MRIYDVLYAMNTGDATPKARPFDNLLWQALSGDTEEKTIDFTPVISVSDAVGGNALDYQIKITAKQTGTPSPQNICPITGWMGAQITRVGKNLLSPSYFKQAIIDSCDSRITIDGDKVTLPNGSGNVNSSTSDRVKIFDGEFVENTVYTIIIGAADTPKQYSLFTVFYTDGTSQYMGGNTYDADNKCWRYVTTSGKSVDFIRFNRDQGLVITYDTAKSGIFVGNVSADTFVAYTDSTVYPVSWQTEAGIVYGGVRNLTTGELTVTQVGIVYDGSDDENWGTINLPLNVFGVTGLTDYDSADMCDSYKMISRGSSSGLADLECRLASSSATFMVRDTNYATLNAFKDSLALSPITVVYTLFTPQTYTLTPTEITLSEGANTIWADTGDSKLTYLAKK